MSLEIQPAWILNPLINKYGYQAHHSYESRAKRALQREVSVDDNHFPTNSESAKEIRRRFFQLMADHQYLCVSNQYPLCKNKIYILCNKPDGFGDVRQAYVCADLIKEKLPLCDFSIVIQCNFTSDREQVRKVFPNPEYPTQFLLRGCPEKKAEIQKIIEEAGSILDVAAPIAGPELTKFLSYRSLREYGFSYHPDCCKKKALSMGLNEKEEGILLPKVEKKFLHEIQSQWLKDSMGISSSEDARAYQEKNSLYHMYIPAAHWDQQIIALFTVVQIEKINVKTIDVVMPLFGTLQELVYKWEALDIEILKNNGIGKLTCVMEEDEESLEFGEGKELRILKGKIPVRDTEILQQHSHEFFGCTGDGSISTAFVLDSNPLYAAPPHKENFLNSWVNLGENLHLDTFVEFSQVISSQTTEREQIYKKNTPRRINYYAADPSYDFADSASVPRKSLIEIKKNLPAYANKIAELYLHSDLVEQTRKLNAYIREKFSAHSRLLAIVSRGLIFSNHPEIAQKEKTIWKDYKYNKIDEEQVVESMQAALIDVLGLNP